MFDGQVIISNYKNTPVVTAFIDNKLEFVSFVRDSERGKIYLGKVEHIVKNIDAAFVKYGQDKIGYLPLKKITPACVKNRSFNADDTLRAGDEVVVQIETEAIKTKKARLTTAISLSGKYSVITLGRNGVGTSVKLSDNLRKRLVEAVKESYLELMKESFDCGNTMAGLIIRTDAKELAELPDEEIKAKILKDTEEVFDKLQRILSDGGTRTIYSQLYGSGEGTDLLKKSTDAAIAFLKSRNISEYNVIEDSGIHGINSQIEALKSNKVWLKSGAYLIIEQLESFNAIDVNTGKAIKGKSSIAENVNLEAANEIMRQIRLRNLSGMILIDFINLKDDSEYSELIDHIVKLCRMDTVHTNYIDVTGLGIMELTRNKNDKSLKEILHEIEINIDN